MLQIAFLLFGEKLIRKNSFIMIFIGLALFLFGLAVFYDGFNPTHYFSKNIFIFFILIESIFTLIIAPSHTGTRYLMYILKGIFFLIISFLLLSGNKLSYLVVLIIFGLFLLLLSALMITSALIIRNEIWKKSVLYGLVYFIISIYMFLPHNGHYRQVFSLLLTLIILKNSIYLIFIALKSRNIVDGFPQLILPIPEKFCPPLSSNEITMEDPQSIHSQSQLIIHIWTPKDSAGTDVVNRPIINRYIAAVDRNGTISMGHAALEIPSSLYISLYPENDIDRSPSEFLNTLKATEKNNVIGTYQPDYKTESLEWCDSNVKIIFPTYNKQSIINFWNHYKRDKIYNLTYRNCSSSVAYGLEFALNGVLSKNPKKIKYLLHILTSPELWIASQIRQRAITMAWTPGLIMDYSKALNLLVNPNSLFFYQRLLKYFKTKKS